MKATTTAKPEAPQGSALKKVEVQLTREEVLELQCAEERAGRLGLQMEMLRMQAQQLTAELQRCEAAKEELLGRIEAKYGHSIRRFEVKLDTCVASGMVAA